ncbi:MAG: glutamine amidotransferase [Armatimonadetes bacterium]|nr:glutamine amidotransferase [Armatimonadota bacterium]NLN91396.1 glutamine amidotransferase [candidate division WS1 bacterium]
MTGPRLNIAWLYADLMSIYGDRGNVVCLVQRCQWRGIDVAVREIGIGDGLDPAEADLLFIGGAQDREQRLAADDLLARKAEPVREALASGASALAVCGGYQLFGHEYRDAAGTVLRGIGVFDLVTEPAAPGARRIIGNVVASPLLPGCEDAPNLVGFENHGGRTRLSVGAQPLGRVLHGGGNNGEDGFEGCVAGRAVGTYLHGSLLPKNPWLADWLLQAALTRRHPGYELPALDDTLELQARESAERRAYAAG